MGSRDNEKRIRKNEYNFSRSVSIKVKEWDGT